MECNSTVADNTLVPAGTFIDSGTVYKRNTIDANDLFFDAEKWNKDFKNSKKPHGPLTINGREYCFEKGM